MSVGNPAAKRQLPFGSGVLVVCANGEVAVVVVVVLSRSSIRSITMFVNRLCQKIKNGRLSFTLATFAESLLLQKKFASFLSSF